MPLPSRTLLFALAVLLPARLHAALWVAQGGDDRNPGTEEQPLRTLEAARDRVRTLLPAMQDDVTVFIGGGTYRLEAPLQLTAADSGMNGFNVVYTAATDQHPIISGGIAVTGWRLVDPARNLWSAPAPARLQATRQLYVDGVRASRTRGRPPVEMTQTASGYATATNELARWRTRTTLEFVYTGGDSVWSEHSQALGPWTEPRIPVTSIEGTAITMAQPAWANSTLRVMYPNPAFKRPANLVGPASVGKRPVTMENAYDLLGTPGQWFLDPAERTLYYVPRSGENLATADVEVPAIEVLVDASGAPAAPIHNIVFKGIAFEYATWNAPSGPEGFPEIQANYLVTGEKGYAVQGLGDLVPGGTHPYGAWTREPGNVRFTYSHRIQFLEDAFVHLGAAGLDLGNGSQEDTVEGCVFTDISGNGCELGCVDLPLGNEREVTRDNRIANSHFSNVGAEYHGGIPIVVGYAQRTLITRNQIDHVPYAAISMGWGGWPDKVHKAGVANNSRGNVISQNLIFDLMLLLADGGGIYTQGLTGPSLADGERVVGNVVMDQFGSGHAIYTDNGSCNITVAGNVMFHTNHDNWGSRHADYYDGGNGKSYDPLAITGNYWQQGDPDSSAKGVSVTGNHLISALADVPAEVIAAAGIEPSFRSILGQTFARASAPEAPSRIAADAEDGFAYVTWNPPCFLGGSPVTTYLVQASTGPSVSITAEEFKARGYARVPGLRNAAPVTFTVAAVNATGASVPSLPSLPVTPGPRERLKLPGAPSKVSARVSGGKASIHISAPESNGGSPVVAYVVVADPGARRYVLEGRKFIVLGGTHTTFDTIDGVPADAATFSISAVTAAGQGPAAIAKAGP